MSADPLVSEDPIVIKIEDSDDDATVPSLLSSARPSAGPLLSWPRPNDCRNARVRHGRTLKSFKDMSHCVDKENVNPQNNVSRQSSRGSENIPSSSKLTFVHQVPSLVPQSSSTTTSSTAFRTPLRVLGSNSVNKSRDKTPKFPFKVWDPPPMKPVVKQENKGSSPLTKKLAKRRISGGQNFRYWNVNEKSCSFTTVYPLPQNPDNDKENVDPSDKTNASTPLSHKHRKSSIPCSNALHTPQRDILGERDTNKLNHKLALETPIRTPSSAVSHPPPPVSSRKTTPLFKTQDGKAQLFLSTPAPTPTAIRPQDNTPLSSRNTSSNTPLSRNTSSNSGVSTPSRTKLKSSKIQINLASIADSTADAALLRMLGQRARKSQTKEKEIQDKEAAIRNLLALKSGVWG